MRACVSSLLVFGLACQRAPHARDASRAGTVVTVYVTPQEAERVIDPLLKVAARHQWVISIRTDSEALREADLILADSAGRLVGHVPPGAAAEAQARTLAEAVLHAGAP